MADSDERHGGSGEQSEELSAEEIEELVENLADEQATGRKGSAGGSVREKYTCKCCGARVDSGQHKCSLCVEAGCSMGQKKCQFH